MIKRSVVAALAVACAMAAWEAVAAEDTAPKVPAASTGLAELSLEELMNIEISVASKRPETTFEAPGVVVVVPRAEIDLYGDRTLYQLMQRQPSVYPRRSYVYGESMAAFRGDMVAHSETHTLILINGRPVRESAQAISSPMYMAFPLASVESIELIRGPGSVLYGSNAFGGVINIKTLPVPEQREISVSAMGGSYGYYDLVLRGGGTFGQVGFTGTIRVAGQDGWPYRFTDREGVYQERDVDDGNVAATAHLEAGRFSLDVFGADMDAFALGVASRWADANQDFRAKRLFVNAGYDIPLHERARLELNLTYNLQEAHMYRAFIPPIPPLGINTSDVLAEVTLFANPTDKLNLVVGALQQYISNFDPPEGHFSSIPSYHYWPRSAYAQGDYAISDAVKLIAGTQWNESPHGDSDFVSRGGVIVTPHKNWGIKLLSGEAFRAPITMETDCGPGLVGNPDLDPETITTTDVQVFYHDEKTYAAVTYFHSDIDGQILFDGRNPEHFTYMNGGKQEFEGIELEAKRFLTSSWHVLGSFMTYDYEGVAGLNHTVVPDEMLKLGTGYTWDGGSAALFMTHFGTPPVVESAVVVNPEPESVSLLSANVRLDVSRWVGLDNGQAFVTLHGENLLDEEVYVPTLAYSGVPNSFPYGAGRTLYLGVEMHF
jgi:outer membrane receptor for ferrienterochelin and colicins